MTSWGHDKKEKWHFWWQKQKLIAREWTTWRNRLRMRRWIYQRKRNANSERQSLKLNQETNSILLPHMGMPGWMCLNTLYWRLFTVLCHWKSDQLTLLEQSNILFSKSWLSDHGEYSPEQHSHWQRHKYLESNLKLFSWEVWSQGKDLENLTTGTRNLG